MIFKQLKLKNFKSHKDTTIDFTDGITMIIGENGAGKSSIFEAISFALYKKTTGKGISSLVRSNKGIEGIVMSVELTFLNNGVEYKVIREKHKSKSVAKLFKRDTQSFDFLNICTGDAQVNKEIKNILQMDADLFLNAIYVRQGEIADLVGKTPAERKRLIGKLLKLEELEKSWKDISPIINIYDNKAAELKGLISSSSNLSVDLKIKQQELIHLSERTSELSNQIESLEKIKESISENRIKLEEEKRIFEGLKLRLESEEKLYANIKKSKDELQDQVDEINKLEVEKDRLEKYSKKLPIYLDFEEAINNIEQLKKEKIKQEDLIKLIEFHKNVVDEKKSANDDYVSLESKIKSLNEDKSKLAADSKLLNQYIDDKKKEETKLENLNKDLEVFKNKSKDVLGSFIDEDEIKEMDDDFNFDKLIKTIELLKNKLKEDLSSKEESIKNYKIEISTLESTVKSSRKPLSELNKADDKCPICQSNISEDKKDELITSYQETILDSEIRIDKIRKEIPKINELNKVLSSQIKIIEDFEKEIYENKDLYQKINEVKENIKEISEKIESLGSVKDKIKEFDALIKDAEKNHEELKDSYTTYVQSLGVLKSLAKDYEAKEGLYIIEGKISAELERVKVAIDNDSYLTEDIPKDTLKSKIDELKQKDLRFNQLTALIRQKPKFNSQLNEKKEEIKLKLNDIEKIKNSLKESKYDEENYEKIKLLEESNSNRLSKFTKEFAEISGRSKEIIPIIQSLEESVKKNKIYKEELDNTKEFISLLNEIRVLFSKDGIQKVLRKASRPSIQRYTKEFFEQFNFNYSDLTLDENYEISLYGPEGKAELDMVSGGEKIAIALALRLGITQAMSQGGIETILLDEPTIHLDSYRRDELGKILNEMAVIPQMIIVSHEDSFESSTNNVYKIKKVDGISKVKLES